MYIDYELKKKTGRDKANLLFTVRVEKWETDLLPRGIKINWGDTLRNIREVNKYDSSKLYRDPPNWLNFPTEKFPTLSFNIYIVSLEIDKIESEAERLLTLYRNEWEKAIVKATESKSINIKKTLEPTLEFKEKVAQYAIVHKLTGGKIS